MVIKVWGMHRGGGCGRRRRMRGRPVKPRKMELIDDFSSGIAYYPEPILVNPPVNSEEITLDELEALKLVYLEDLSYEEASERMNVSRGTIWRLAESGRKKLIKAIIEKRPFYIIAK